MGFNAQQFWKWSLAPDQYGSPVGLHKAAAHGLRCLFESNHNGRGIIWYCWSQAGGGPQGVGIHDKPELKACYKSLLSELKAAMPGLTSTVRRPFEEGAIHGIALGAPSAGGKRFLLMVNTSDTSVEADFAVPELERVRTVWRPDAEKVEKKDKSGNVVKDKNGAPVMVDPPVEIDGGRVHHAFAPYETLMYRW